MAYTDLSALLETATEPTAEPEPAPTRRRKPTRARRLATSADADAEPAPAEHPTQTAIRMLLNGIGEGLTMRELGQAIDVSRQTGLYHAKRLVARNEVVLVLEPCPANGQTQFRAWAHLALATHYARVLMQTVYSRP